MADLISKDSRDPWVRRLLLPAYQVKEAARYATITTQTVRNWQARDTMQRTALPHRDKWASLSYLQLVELAFVSVLRKMGVSLVAIKNHRDYIGKQLQTEYPFAHHRFKTDGKNIIVALSEFDTTASSRKWVFTNRGGQLTWGELIDKKFQEFDYKKELAVRWHVAGPKSPIVIDPQIAFGAPTIRGVPTWAIGGRCKAGESIEDIADDFRIKENEVKQALQFERVNPSAALSSTKWAH